MNIWTIIQMKKQQKNLYALYIERESKKGSYMEENVEQISINVEKVNKIKSNFPDEDLLFDIAENFKVGNVLKIIVIFVGG